MQNVGQQSEAKKLDCKKSSSLVDTESSSSNTSAAANNNASNATLNPPPQSSTMKTKSMKAAAAAASKYNPSSSSTKSAISSGGVLVGCSAASKSSAGGVASGSAGSHTKNTNNNSLNRINNPSDVGSTTATATTTTAKVASVAPQNNNNNNHQQPHQNHQHNHHQHGGAADPTRGSSGGGDGVNVVVNKNKMKMSAANSSVVGQSAAATSKVMSKMGGGGAAKTATTKNNNNVAANSTSSGQIQPIVPGAAEAFNQQSTAAAGGAASSSTSALPSSDDTYPELQPTDISESDEESMSGDDSDIPSEIPSDIRSDIEDGDVYLDETNDEDDEEDDDDDDDEELEGEEDEDEDDDEDDDDEDEDEEEDEDDLHDKQEIHGKFLLDSEDVALLTQHDKNIQLDALLEAAKANENVPVLRNATLALDEAAQALNRMRNESNPRDRKILRGFSLLSRSLIAACADNDVSTVRRLLGDGNNTINEGTDDGESLLSLACSAGYYELAQVLLAMSAQVEDRGQKNDCTPLMEAASAGHVDIIHLLVTHNADVNAQSSTGNTPLMYACAGGHVDAVRALLKHGAHVEDHNENGHTPLMEAASAGHVEVAKILLNNGAGINTHSNEFKESALTLACYKGHLDMVRFLLEAGADQEHKTDEMHTALMEASMDGHVEVARLLLDSGAQVNMPTDSFESPLTLAACGGHVDLAMLLIERGANIEEVNDEGYTPLMEAAREGHEEMVALLLSQGTNINAQTEETQETALTLACCGGFLEVADYLMKNGADIELGASTPLMEAAQEGHMELVKFLLENGANVHAQTQTGDTALTYACENGHTDVAEVLLYYGAELEHESEGGRTPLMKACRAGHICTIKFLIGKGAKVNRQTTSNDHTPLSLACAGGHQAVVELLLKNGADPFHKLKDNSTMLIEAAKGGHIGVVQLLLDYPESMLNAVATAAATAAAAASTVATPSNVEAIVHQQQQLQFQQQQQHQHQQQDDQKRLCHPSAMPLGQVFLAADQLRTKQQRAIQQMSAPPGLHEVPESVRVSNQQLFQQVTNELECGHPIQPPQPVAGPSSNFMLDSAQAAATSSQLQESVLANMRILRHQGFKDGLAHGLGRTPLEIVNQLVNTNTAQVQTVRQHSPPPMSSPHQKIQTTQSSASAPTMNVKQKSLLRKTRQHPQPPAPFELDDLDAAVPADAVRSQPIGEEEAIIQDMPGLSLGGDQLQQQKQILEEFQILDTSLLKSSTHLIPDSNGPSTTRTNVAPNLFDLSNPLQVACKTEANNAFLLTTMPATNQAPQNFGNVAAAPTSTHLSAPSEVSQNTAISDRPKVKPVSKKDGKNLRKAAAAAAAAATGVVPGNSSTTAPSGGAISQPNSLPTIANSADSHILIQQAMHTCNTSQLRKAHDTQSSNCIAVQNPQILPMLNQTVATINAPPTTRIDPSMVYEGDNQLRINDKIIQMVAQIPNTTLQKFAQRLIVDDQPKSPSDSPPISNIGNTSSMAASNDLADISRIFCEVIRSELNANTPPEFHVHQKQCNQLPPSSVSGTSTASGASSSSSTSSFQRDQIALQHHFQQQQQRMHEHGKYSPGTFFSQHEDHLHMFTVEDVEEEQVDEHTGVTGLFPLNESLDSLNTTADVDVSDTSRDQINDYEWANDIDVINVLHGVSDWPVALQEVAAHCPDFSDYANLIGINTSCKLRWTGQWPSSGQRVVSSSGDVQTFEETLTPHAIAAFAVQQAQQQCGENVTGQPIAGSGCSDTLMLIEHQHQQIQKQLCLDQFELLSHLQNMQQQQNEMSQLIPSTVEASHLNQLQMAASSTTSQLMATSAIISKFATHQQPTQPQTQLQSADAQQQTKFVFNVESEKAAPSLQLLFQLPTIQPQPIEEMAACSSSTQTTTQTSAQVSSTSNTSVDVSESTPSTVTQPPPQQQQPQQKRQQPQPRNPAIVQAGGKPSSSSVTPSTSVAGSSSSSNQMPVAQNSQVQVSTQTQLQPTSTSQSHSGDPPPPHHLSAVPVEPIGGTPAQQSAANAAKLAQIQAVANRKAEKSRKERNRYHVMRQAPAGSQANTTQTQYPSLPTPPAAPVPAKTIDVDSETDSNHDTALTLACAGGHEELVELLISRGANIEHRDKKGFTPLILAATAGHEKVVNTLLKQGAEIEAQSERTKDTPLSLACSGGRYEVVEILLNVGANKEHRNVSDYTPLSLAASGGYVNIIKLLLNSGAEINSRTGSKLGISPLMLAAMNGHTAAVRMLLDMGSDINAQIETNRNTALTLACFQGRHEVVSLLLDRKANVEHRAKTGLTPLMEAASGGYIEVGRVLLDKGADVNAAPVPSSRDTALTIAADKGHLKFVDLLLARNAAVEVKNKKGNSPLWLSANGGHLAVVKVLYGASADIDSQDNRKVSCLMAAFRKGHNKVVEWMVSYVTQFPSDQEMTRYIGTISDKELMEKCRDCVNILRNAKEAQAVRANKNASILLEELDMERNREESRKAAAARRRERKKKKKLEKKEEKRKQLEVDYDENGEEVEPEEEDKDEDSEKEEDAEPETERHDKEEGDSGIDANSQGSCSSTEVKVVPVGEKPPIKAKKNKNKKQKENKAAAAASSAAQVPEPTPVVSVASTASTAPAKKKEDNQRKHLKESPALNAAVSQSKIESKPTEKQPIKASASARKDTVGSSVTAPREDIKKSTDKKTDDSDNCRKTLVFGAREEETGNDSNYFNSAKNKHNKGTTPTVNSYSSAAAAAASSTSLYGDDLKLNISVNKPQNNNPGKREDGWKEVIRKSSIQQAPVAAENACKKVQVPVHAISRVIGRAGSNINAIRAATGAHIEVEKQGKNQNDRWITIKGSIDATKQAHYLITALIKDPDVDILQMLPRVNINAKPTPAPISVWDKNTTVTVSSSVNTPGKIKPPVLPIIKPVAPQTTTLSAVKTPVRTTSIVTVATKSTATYSSTTTQVQPRISSSATGIRPLSAIVTSAPAAVAPDSSSTIKRPATSAATAAATSTAPFFPTTILTNPKNGTPQKAVTPSTTFASKLTTTSMVSTVLDKKSTTVSTGTSSLSQQTSTMTAIQPSTTVSSSTPSTVFVSEPTAPLTTTTTTTNTAQQQLNNALFMASQTGSVTPQRALTPIGHQLSRTVTPLPQTIKSQTTTGQQQNLSGTSVHNIAGDLAASSNLKEISSPANRLVTQSPLAPIGSSMQANKTNTQSAQHGNSPAHEYSLFNASYGNGSSQWGNETSQTAKQLMFNNYGAGGGGFMENESIPKADASKAPGYRGSTTMSSPVSSKTSSTTTTPPNSQMGHVQMPVQPSQQQPPQMSSAAQSQNLQIAVSGLSVATALLQISPGARTPGGACGGQSHSAGHQQQQQYDQSGLAKQVTPLQQQQQQPQQSQHPQQQLPTQQQPPQISSGLAVQRPNIGSIGSGAPRQQQQQQPIGAPSQLSSAVYGISNGGASNRDRYFDSSSGCVRNSTGGGSAMNMMAGSGYGQHQLDSIQSQYHQHVQQQQQQQQQMSAISRLNPRASVFSSIQPNTPQPQQQHANKTPGGHHYGGMMHQQQQQQQHQQMSSNSLSNYQKNMPGLGGYAVQPIGSQLSSAYSSTPSQQRPQSQPQSGNSAADERWMYMSHASQRDLLNMENGMDMGLGSPAMSPNTAPPNSGGVIGGMPNSIGLDDSRKMPRPIGTERSWKYGNFGGPGLESDLMNQSWMLDNSKQQQQQQQHQQMPWMAGQQQQPQPLLMSRNPYGDDLQSKDYYPQTQMDYYNNPLMQNQPSLNLMQAMQYQTILPPDLGGGNQQQQQQPTEPWEQHDKHGWSKWAN